MNYYDSAALVILSFLDDCDCQIQIGTVAAVPLLSHSLVVAALPAVEVPTAPYNIDASPSPAYVPVILSLATDGISSLPVSNNNHMFLYCCNGQL